MEDPNEQGGPDSEHDDSHSGRPDNPHLEPGTQPATVPNRTSPQGPTHPTRLEQETIPGIGPGISEESLRTILTEIQRFEAYSGPIPAPSHLQQYNEVVPGAADKIIDAVYVAPSRRQDDIVKARVQVAKSGQSAAIFLAVVSFISSIVFFAIHNNYAGSAMLGVPLVQLILSFFPSVSGRRRKDSD